VGNAREQRCDGEQTHRAPERCGTTRFPAASSPFFTLGMNNFGNEQFISPGCLHLPPGDTALRWSVAADAHATLFLTLHCLIKYNIFFPKEKKT